jgi:hypothetical protein
VPAIMHVQLVVTKQVCPLKIPEAILRAEYYLPFIKYN